MVDDESDAERQQRAMLITKYPAVAKFLEKVVNVTCAKIDDLDEFEFVRFDELGCYFKDAATKTFVPWHEITSIEVS